MRSSAGSNKWRLLAIEVRGPYENMACDEAILIAASQRLVPPTLRFYRWSAPTVSIGYFQDAGEVDIEYCHIKGYGFVRRPTGGGGIFHDDELTYACIGHGEDGLGRNLFESYAKICRALLRGMGRLGLEAGFGEGGGVAERFCFLRGGPYDILVYGKKVVGSAQRRFKGAVLQHGSILVGFAPQEAARIFGGEEQHIREKVAGLREFLAELGVEEVAEAMVAGFGEEFGVDIVPGELSSYEEELVKELVEKKYSTTSWNMERRMGKDASI